MKENIDDINADIALQYGEGNMERNIAFVLSLIQSRMKDNGEVDDNIPVPSVEAAAKTILLLVGRPELPWESICREQRVRRVVEYLFIRARNHYGEVQEFVDRLIRQHLPGIPPQTLRVCLNAWKQIVSQQQPSKFTDEILYPEHADAILDTLHFLLQGEVGRGAALVMVCARDEGLVRSIAHAKVVTEFRHVTKTAYNNYIYERFTDSERKRVIGTLRTRIGYTKHEDGRITFLPDTSNAPNRKNAFISLWRMLKALAE